MSMYPTNVRVLGVKTFGLPVTGQVYKIQCKTTGLCYYGSTINSLEKRLAGHKSAYQLFIDKKSNSTLTSFQILAGNNYAISAIEFVDVRMLKMRERYHIEHNTCVNRVIPTRTKGEWIATFRDKVLGYKKKWRDDNKEHMKQYYIDVVKPRIEARRKLNCDETEL